MQIEEAFRKVPRARFLPPDVQGQADLDMPLPIGYGQTNSQPTTVRMMLEWLDVKNGQKILDVGSGSGWTTALLSQLIGKNGYVTAVERIPELVEFARRNLLGLSVDNAEINQAKDDGFGWSDSAPYDRILVSAAGKSIPEGLIDQLKPSGKMVIPVKYDIFVLSKSSRGEITKERHPGFVFVPLVPPKSVR